MREKTKLNATKDVSKQKSLFRIWIGFFVKYIGILIAAGVVGILLLTFAYHIPVNQESKDSTFEYSEQMGWAPLVNNRYTQYIPFFTSYEIGTLDDATDRTILNNCYNEGEESAIKRAADMNDYGRYWHGYVAILRPIFYFMDYWDYLLVNSFAQLFVMGCVGYAIYKATGQKRYLLAFFCSCAFLTPAATAMSLQNSPVFYVAMLGSLFVLLKTDWILEKNRRYYLFLFLGIVTCYFDFLTYPLLSFAFPFCWLLVAAGEKVNLEIRHYGKADGAYRLYDDDGETFDYEKGAYSWRDITVTRDKKGKLKGAISKAEKGKPNSIANVTWKFMTKE